MDGITGFTRRRTRPTRWFDDFFVGERFDLPARTLTEHAVRAFAEASGERFAFETDGDITRSPTRDSVISQGFLVTIQTVPGAAAFPFSIENSLIRMLDQSSRFLRSAQIGDTLTPVLQVTELEPNMGTGIVSLRGTIHNQRRELVLEASQRWLIRMRPAQ